MEIIELLGKKCISYGGSYLCSDTEDKVINFYNECVEMDKKYPEDVKYIRWDGLMAFYQRRL